MWKVLIADDEPKIRQGLKSVLEEMKLPITVCAEARNGMEALEKIEQFQPDFILMDICMPKLSGIQFLEELRKLDKNCPVIVISGFKYSNNAAENTSSAWNLPLWVKAVAFCWWILFSRLFM